MKQLVVACTLVCIAAACTKKQTDYESIFNNPDLYSKTVYELNNVVMNNNFSPMVASRNYAYANIAAYEAIAGLYPNQYYSLAGQLAGLKEVSKPGAGKPINAGFAALLAFWKLGVSVTFSDNETENYVDSIKRMAKEHGMPDEVYNNSIDYADAVGNAIMAWSKKDNYLETRSMSKFTVYSDSPGRWVPTPPAYSDAAEPHWSEMRQLVIDSVNEFLPPPAYRFDVTNKKSDYYKEVKQIEKGGDSLTDEQALIADFWDDNPFKLNVNGHVMFGTKKFSPGGHWMGITGIAAKKAGASLPETICAFTKTSIALFDAFIQCWNIKYRYNTVRPETVIDKYFDPNWRPHLQTPPFPEYTCGHCYISASAAEALTSMFGDSLPYTDTTEMEFGIPARSYQSFREAANEVKISRFYGGIHFHYSVMISHDMGKEIGDLIVDKLKMKKA
ncbi:MAG: vanadium-dependent haloperoxidase [Bacteroidota bacterium]|nr:vanadium-dependent haloperoxidase [Bacteroidota bacterium]